MTIYFLLISLMLSLWIYTYENYQKHDIRASNCCMILCISLVIVAALRGASVGTDTKQYVQDYNNVSYLSWNELYLKYRDNPGYYILSKLFVSTHFSIQVWFGFVALLYIGAITLLIKKFTKDVVLCYILFVTLGLYAFSLAGLKQTIAMAFTIYAYLFFAEKKYVGTVCLLILATICHASAIVFLLVFVIRLFAHSKKYYFLLSIGFVVFIYAYEKILNLGLGLLNNEHYVSTYIGTSQESNGNLTMFFILLLILIVSFIYIKKCEAVNEYAREQFGIAYIGTLSHIMSLVAASAFRIGLYFNVFSIIILVNCINEEKNTKIRRLIKVGIVILFIFFFWYTNHNGSSVVPYKFFWE